MVVAHADDESLFGGELLSQAGGPWLVVVVAFPEEPSEQMVREEELVRATRHSSHVVSVRILGYPECSTCAPFHSELYADLAALLAEQAWRRIVTHGFYGEYGHPQHHELAMALAALVGWQTPLWFFQPKYIRHPADQIMEARRRSMLDAYDSQQHILRLYQNWSFTVVPLQNFNSAHARRMCSKGAGDVSYYQTICALPVQWPRSVDLDYVQSEMLAFPLQHLSRELSQSADVGLYGLPVLRRFLNRRAMERVPSQLQLCACITGAASAMAWMAMSLRNCARVLPHATLTGRLLQDVTSSSLLASDYAVRFSDMDIGDQDAGPVQLAHAALYDCSFLLGPVASILAMMRHHRSKRMRQQWQLAVYGDLGAEELESRRQLRSGSANVRAQALAVKSGFGCIPACARVAAGLGKKRLPC